MIVETDELAEAAQRFSEAIRAERTSTLDALAMERQAALQIIESLRQERGRRAVNANGRFAIGVAIGLALGAAAIYFVNQRASEEARLGLTADPLFSREGARITDRLKAAVEEGKRAARRHEDELWQHYREQVKGQNPDGEFEI